jgi:hypothetical protein
MRDFSGRALCAWEAFVSVLATERPLCQVGAAFLAAGPVPLAPKLPTQACSIYVAASAGLRPRHECYGGQLT